MEKSDSNKIHKFWNLEENEMHKISEGYFGKVFKIYDNGDTLALKILKIPIKNMSSDHR
jgi:hypothetical protein